MQTSLVEWLCIRTPFLKVTTFAKNVAIRWKTCSITSQFQGEPSYVCTESFYWISSEITAFLLGKCSMLLCKIESIFEFLQHGFEKSAISLAHSLKHVVYLWKCRFLFAKCAALLQESVARAYCRFHRWCKNLFKNIFFFVLEQALHHLLQYVFP